VYGSGVSIRVTWATWPRIGELFLASLNQSIVNLTSSAVSSRPEWNFTPLRSSSLIDLPSRASSNRSAKSGIGLTFWS